MLNLCKVGNQTSSQDPHAINSRVFVGNLNTFQVNKIDVEKVFQRYGRIVGISMHKGYAFVQFASPFDARSACLGEDGRTISSQTIDVNMVSEPKSHQGKGKQPKRTSESNDDDSVLVKDPKDETVQSRKRRRSTEETPKITAADLNELKTYDIADILICGNCKELFSNLKDIMNHKKFYCKLRFTCKCGPKWNVTNSSHPSTDASRGLMEQHQCSASGPHPQRTPPHHPAGGVVPQPPVSLLCSSCEESFGSPMELMVHVQDLHNIPIFEMDSSAKDGTATEIEV
ncbi:uncharacterized protein LOC131885651 [Tigriopus californicus]|uniref:uncharacterized protein LOC131885651 n=1 Tax=Tigriopus californicus TaxID=6832 RepID=UPI0027D9FA65|nr:uncharacterized protein LOC131885651 [Tigriopus californicus]